MKRWIIIKFLVLLALAQTAIAAPPPQWTWEAGKQTNNGAITIKSVNGSTTYSGTQNPTGAVAKTNQNAVTQPPTIIVQASGDQIKRIQRGYFNFGWGTVIGSATIIAVDPAKSVVTLLGGYGLHGPTGYGWGIWLGLKDATTVWGGSLANPDVYGAVYYQVVEYY